MDTGLAMGPYVSGESSQSYLGQKYLGRDRWPQPLFPPESQDSPWKDSSAMTSQKGIPRTGRGCQGPGLGVGTRDPALVSVSPTGASRVLLPLPGPVLTYSFPRPLPRRVSGMTEVGDAEA